MKRVTRFSIAVTLVGILALTASGVWASQKFKGTVPHPPHDDDGDCSETIDMGTALFTALRDKNKDKDKDKDKKKDDDDCTMSVEWIGNDTGEYALPPEGLACLSDTFEVTIDPPTVLVRVCYAYPPELAEKNARIYRLNEEANPQVWVEVPGANIGDGVICVTSAAGYFALIGNP